MSFRRSALLVPLAAISMTISGLAPNLNAAAADSPAIVGAACAAGQGVTFVVDFTPAKSEIQAGCAVGAQKTIADAGKAAGFTLEAVKGFVCSIDGQVAEAKGCSSWPGAYWSLLTSTADGKPDGPTSTTWQSANVGIAGGPVPAGSALLFQIQPYDAAGTLKTPLVPLSDVLTRADNTPGDPDPADPVASAPPTSTTEPTSTAEPGSTARPDTSTASGSTASQPPGSPATPGRSTSGSSDLATTSQATAAVTGSAGPSSGADDRTSADATVDPAAPSDSGTGWVLAVVAAALVAAGAAIAIVLSRRRRRTS